MTDHQQKLPLDLPGPLTSTRLISAGSAREAYYQVEVIHLNGFGYVIRKLSGAKGAKPNIDAWSRPSYADAVEKEHNLINGKLRKTKGRLYEIQSVI